MTKRLHDCLSCDGKTRHDNPSHCSECRLFHGMWDTYPATRTEGP